MTINEALRLVESIKDAEFVYPKELGNDIYLSKLNTKFCLSYHDKRAASGKVKKFNLSKEQVEKILKRKL